MAASNFSNPQFTASPARQVQSPVDNVPAQSSGNSLKSTLTGLAQLGMGIATGDPALMATGASTTVLGPKAGKLAGTLANVAGGGSGDSAGDSQQSPPAAPTTSAAQTAGSTAASTGSNAVSNAATQAAGGGSGPFGGPSQQLGSQTNSGITDPLALASLMQLLGKSAPNPTPQNNQQGTK